VARANKIGLDYFPLNIDMDEEDERVYMLEAEFGIQGFGILIKLLMWIYRNGYYYHWGEKEQIFFARKKAIDVTLCRQVCDFCIQNGFFCKHLFDKYGILTSRGIQKRYFEAVQRRKKVPFIKEFLLLDPGSEINDNINLIYVSINQINAYKNGINADMMYAKVHKGEESKGEERRVKESKVKKKKGEEKKEASPPPSAPEINSPLQKTPTDNNSPPEQNWSKSKVQQLRELAEHLRIEDPAEYQQLLSKHPELIEKEPEEVPFAGPG